MKNIIPYPLRALKISLDINIFGFWWKPCIQYRKCLSESARQQGDKIWWGRWLWFQINISRWV